MSKVDTPLARVVLIIGHVAGMVDMAALPLWVGNLVERYGFNPQQAGGVVTLFLLGVVVATLAVAPRFDRLPRRYLPAAGYGVAAFAFFASSNSHQLGQLAMLHFLGGLGVGCGFSLTLGTMGRSLNPQRIFAYATAVLGVFAIAFLGQVPGLLVLHGGPIFFTVMMSVMLVAALCTGLGFPVASHADQARVAQREPAQRFGRGIWLAIFAVVLLLTLNHAMTFSFIERIGIDRQFGANNVTRMLIASGVVGLFPSLIATLLQKRLSPYTVLIAVPWVQVGLAFVITHATTFMPYAFSGAVFPFVSLFASTFMFGLMARLDPSGRAVAATPAMIMAGSAIAPFLAGTLVLGFGYEAIASGIAVVAFVSMMLVLRVSRATRALIEVSIGMA